MHPHGSSNTIFADLTVGVPLAGTPPPQCQGLHVHHLILCLAGQIGCRWPQHTTRNSIVEITHYMWQNPQSDVNINEDQQVLFLYRIYFNYREEHLLLISFPFDLCFIRGADLQESFSDAVPVNTSVVTPGEIPTQPTASEFQPHTSSEETQGPTFAVITTTILR